MAANELILAVGIGEGVKQIVMIAGKVRSIATNAILIAHRAGDLARGFGVLSRELRGFTDQVNTQMSSLSACTFDLVTEVSGLLRQTHRAQILRRTMTLLTTPSPLTSEMNTLLERHNCERSRRMEAIAELRGRLKEALATTDQIAQYGMVLARTAMIEAAYGGNHSQALSGVAREFNETILLVIQALDAVRRAAHGRPPTAQESTQ